MFRKQIQLSISKLSNCDPIFIWNIFLHKDISTSIWIFIDIVAESENKFYEYTKKNSNLLKLTLLKQLTVRELPTENIEEQKIEQVESYNYLDVVIEENDEIWS